MSEQKINPNQVTKPIQLLAAWLVGLILINGSFLGAAKAISSPEWAPGLLVIAATLNVPIFLSLIFFLQTKFRAELQEDTYYSKHLEKVTGAVTDRNINTDKLLDEMKKVQASNNKIEAISRNIEEVTKSLSAQRPETIDIDALLKKLQETKNSISSLEEQKIKSLTSIAINDLIPSYQEILNSIIRSGYSISQTFGSNSADKNPPKYLTITYTPETPKASIIEIYKILKPHGFNRIDYDDSEINKKSTIFIGSYIDSFPESRRSVVINETTEGLILDNEISGDQLGEYIAALRAQ